MTKDDKNEKPLSNCTQKMAVKLETEGSHFKKKWHSSKTK